MQQQSHTAGFNQIATEKVSRWELGWDCTVRLIVANEVMMQP